MSRAGGDTRSLLQVLVDRQVHTDACVDKLKDKVDVLSASHVEHKASIDAGVRAAKWLIGLSIAILGIGGPMGTACYVESIHHQHVSVAEARPQMWAYVQRNGDLYKDGVWKARAYSGFGIGKNNPDLQELMDIGPLPTGLWKFVGPPFDSATHGPFCLRILPEPLTQTFGRSAFILHGDNINHLGSSSHGCIVASPIDVREMVWNEIQATGDDLVLVASEPPINQQPEVS